MLGPRKKKLVLNKACVFPTDLWKEHKIPPLLAFCLMKEGGTLVLKGLLTASAMCGSR